MPESPRKNQKPAPLGLSPEAAALAPKSPSEKPHITSGEKIEETGGPKGAEPTRFGDWERKGRCSDF